MRVTSGAFRGRTLLAPPGRTTRPTADRVRQAMFNLLRHGLFFDGGERGFLDGVAVLDVFAGSGALGLEALSNGADFVSFVENARAPLAALRENAAKLGVETRCAILAVDAAKPPPPTRAHGLVFLDPPYGKGLGQAAIAALSARGWFAAGAVLVLEEAEGFVTSPLPGCEALDRRSYGETEVHLWRWNGAAP
jgi:16S rRNA (guanine966-N2)-methyltransferase